MGAPPSATSDDSRPRRGRRDAYSSGGGSPYFGAPGGILVGILIGFHLYTKIVLGLYKDFFRMLLGSEASEEVLGGPRRSLEVIGSPRKSQVRYLRQAVSETALPQ